MRLQETNEYLDELEREFSEALERDFRRGEDGEPSQQPARLSLTQIADTFFRVGDSLAFRRQRVDADAPSRWVVVEPSDFKQSRTDLTSVPASLTWFVPKYGRHTPAALVHDGLLDRATEDFGDDLDKALEAYEEADTIFREALRSLGVPPLRRTLMWSAVCFGTRLRTAGRPRRMIQLWLLSFLVGIVALGFGIARGDALLIGMALAGPFPASLLWGRQRKAAMVAGGAALFIAVPTGAVVGASLLYEVLERVVGLFVGKGDPGRGAPRPNTGIEYAPLAIQQRRQAG